ncbi:MAG TPA: hypothetical protein VG474_08085, partial [Solirubrobacteraceae bacterium]|nr:hypothetical protein [Solirubrobacteraceae bacterium]
MRVIDDHADQRVAHLRFPLEHRKRSQHERSRTPSRRCADEPDHRPLPRRDLGAAPIWAVLELA